MRFSRSSFVFAALLALSALVTPTLVAAQQRENLTAKPLSESETLRGVTLKPVKAGPLRVPTITWPGDVATLYTESEGIFKNEGLNVTLFRENDLAKQAKGFIEGDTPLLRGTMGMINAACEAAVKSGVGCVVIYQLTWSNGGDMLVVRQNINSLSDLKGKNIVLQLYGPHMDFATTALRRAGLKPSDVNLTWVRDLTVPDADNGKIVDPRTAFAADTKLDGAMVISPDGAALTSGGAEGVKGAKVLFSSKSANRVIADVYAVRADYFNANRAQVQKFVHALMVGHEKFQELLASKSANQAKFNALMSKSASLLFGAPQATKDVEDSLGDAEFVDFNDNANFFNGTGTTRNFATLTDEIQDAFISLGLMTGKVALKTASWDYPSLAAGIKNPGAAGIAGNTAAPSTSSKKPAFDATKTQKAVEKQIATELNTWQEAGSLYTFEIYFAPSQSAFSATQYKDAFKKALEISQTFGGALVVVEGHNSPDALNQAKQQGKSATEQSMIEQAAKNLSLTRAQSVRKAYLDYAKAQGLSVDESQFVAVGIGVKSPKYAVPATEAEWNQNRRVVFRIKAVETELDSFKPPVK